MAKVSKKGQWKYPGEDTIIPNANGNITMKGVPYPVLGIDDLGNQQMMMPGMNYQFPGNSVYEIPMMQSGGDISVPDLKRVKIKSLPKAQKGKEWLDLGYENKIYTYKDNPEFFDNHARLSDNPRYNDWIRQTVYSGKWGYNPVTGESVKLNSNQQATVDPITQNLAKDKRTFNEIRKTDKVFDKHLKEAERESGKAVGRAQSKAMVSNPAFYAPGVIGAAAVAPEVLPPLFEGIGGALTTPLINPMTGVAIPGLTGGAIVDAAFAAHGLKAIASGEAIEPWKHAAKTGNVSDYLSAAGQSVITGLETLPVMVPLVKGGLELSKPAFDATGKFLTTQTPLKNAYKLRPNILQENSEVLLHRAQKPGQTPYDPNILRPGAGRGFSSDFGDLYYYTSPNIKQTRGYDVDSEILRLKLPKEKLKEFSVNNTPGYGSARPDVEFILPDRELAKAEKFTELDLGNLAQDYKKFNTPHWWRGFGEKPIVESKPTIDLESLRARYHNGDNLEPNELLQLLEHGEGDIHNYTLNGGLLNPDIEALANAQQMRSFEIPEPEFGRIDLRRGRAQGIPSMDDYLNPDFQYNIDDIINTYKPKRPNKTEVLNKSGFSKEQLINDPDIDPALADEIRQMPDDEFKTTVSSPDKSLQKYKPGQDIKEFSYNPKAGHMMLSDAIPLTSEEYTNIFNENIDRLNQIIAKNNTSGVEYRVTKIDPSGAIEFYHPEQVLADGTILPAGKQYWFTEIKPGQWKGDIQNIPNTQYYQSIPGLNITGSSNTVFADKIARPGTRTYESLNQFLKELDLGRVKPGFNSQSPSAQGVWKHFIEKQKAHGFYEHERLLHGAMKQEGGEQDMLSGYNNALGNFFEDTNDFYDELPEAQVGINVSRGHAINTPVQLNVPQQFQAAPNLMDWHLDKPQQTGWADFTTHRDTGLEADINKWLGKPMDKAYKIAESVAGEGEDPIDSFRHPVAGMYTQQAIKDKIGIPVIGDIAGVIGANLMGIGHEASTIFNDERPWDIKLREAGEDAYNNYVGSIMGAMPGTQDQKINTLYNLSVGNWLPDGVNSQDPNQNLYFKNEDGSINRWSPKEMYNSIYKKQKGGKKKNPGFKILTDTNGKYVFVKT